MPENKQETQTQPGVVHTKHTHIHTLCTASYKTHTRTHGTPTSHGTPRDTNRETSRTHLTRHSLDVSVLLLPHDVVVVGDPPHQSRRLLWLEALVWRPGEWHDRQRRSEKGNKRENGQRRNKA